MTTPTAPLALALLSLDGVGRVSAHRLLERFPTVDALRATPREQVLLRLKGAPHAEQTVATLFDADAFRPALDRAEAEVAALRGKQIHVLAPGGAQPGAPQTDGPGGAGWLGRPLGGWPAGLDDVPRSDRPVVLYAYGETDALRRPALAVLARAPLDGPAFEAAQGIVRRLATPPGTEAPALVVGAQSGVDLALQKVALDAGVPVVVVVEAGLARLRPNMRPGATAVVRAGGVLVSPFPMTHGPYDHDDRERALVQAALGTAVCAVAPPADSPEDRAAAWAAEAGRPLALVPPAGLRSAGLRSAPPGASWAEGALVVDGPAAVETVAGWFG